MRVEQDLPSAVERPPSTALAFLSARFCLDERDCSILISIWSMASHSSSTERLVECVVLTDSGVLTADDRPEEMLDVGVRGGGVLLQRSSVYDRLVSSCRGVAALTLPLLLSLLLTRREPKTGMLERCRDDQEGREGDAKRRKREKREEREGSAQAAPRESSILWYTSQGAGMPGAFQSGGIVQGATACSREWTGQRGCADAQIPADREKARPCACVCIARNSA